MAMLNAEALARCQAPLPNNPKVSAARKLQITAQRHAGDELVRLRFEPKLTWGASLEEGRPNPNTKPHLSGDARAAGLKLETGPNR